MVKLTGVISQLEPVKIVVAGDLMLDAYVIGKAKRISPEAPVPVVSVSHESQLPGGAGNVILNLRSLGAEIAAVGRVGSDNAGEDILSMLSKEGVDLRGVLQQRGYQTSVKKRVIADNQQMVRVDHEVIEPLPEHLEQSIIESLPHIFEGAKALAISDYGKGFLSNELLRALISFANDMQIPIIADPKGTDFTKYYGVTILKPNLSEAYAASGLEKNASIDDVASTLLEKSSVDILMITRSEEGISLFFADGRQEHFPVSVREVKDVTGAGDTVLSILSHALGNSLSPIEASQLANVAAGIAIEKLGCARVTISLLAMRLLEVSHTNKIFDEDHLFALKAALEGKKFVVASVSNNPEFSVTDILALFELSKVENRSLLVYVRDNTPDANFLKVLSSLREIDFIILKHESLKHLCEEIQPDEVYRLESGVVHQIDDVSILNPICV
ncbi:MAG: bifunctional ADP-heptose synthase [Chlamydiota bacterium]|nr:bifunctional ADP-heptose synthase [Chlamydiota bacterium]